jgi:hypothetical protein
MQEPKFEVDVALSDTQAYVTVECRRCIWIVELDAPVDLAVVNNVAEEHKCRSH